LLRKARSIVLAGGIGVIALLGAAGASGATQIGGGCTGNHASTESVTMIGLNAQAGQATSVVPSAGVITSWGTKVIPYPGGISEKLEVFRPAGNNTFTAIGESATEAILGGVNSFDTRIPVQAGDRIGLGSHGGVIYCSEETEPAEEGFVGLVDRLGSEVALGETVTFSELSGAQAPVTATLEPDANGDGFGDETQEACPADGSGQGPCPPAKLAPPSPTPPPSAAPIALSATAAAKKKLLTVSLTSTAQASVTVSGTVKIGKGKSLNLRGGTQIVAPGSLAKFTVLFPAKLTAALRLLPTGKKLTVDLSATAPGATAKELTVKVPGQMKPARRSRAKA
jgi:hypothetical protein